MSDSPAPATSHRELIDRWPSLADFAQAVGVSYGAAKQMRRRNSIPDEYRVAAIADAERRGIAGVTFELLTRLAPARARAAQDGGAEVSA